MNYLMLLGVFCLSLGLISCNETVTAKPFLNGTFSGTYQQLVDSEPDGNPLVITMNLNVTNTSSDRYSFEGTANAGRHKLQRYRRGRSQQLFEIPGPAPSRQCKY